MDIVDDAYRDLIIISWHKLESFVNGLRDEHKMDTIFEWFQWLAEHMEERQAGRTSIPAYIAHKEWDAKNK